MEHSKLHTGIGSKVNRTNIFDSEECFVAEIGPCGRGLDFDVARAKEFVTACNAHAKLKAQGELLDETLGQIKHLSDPASGQAAYRHLLNRIYETSTKAIDEAKAL